MKIGIIILILLFTNTFAQNNLSGQPDKKITEYLSADWRVVKDKRDAVYLRYLDFKEISNEIYYANKKRLEYDKDNQTKTVEGIILLNGEYKWYDKNGKLLTHDKYENGEIVWSKNYMWGIFGKKLTGEKLHEYFDYTRKYNNQSNTFYSEQYDKKGNKTTWFARNGPQGYKYYPVTE